MKYNINKLKINKFYIILLLIVIVIIIFIIIILEKNKSISISNFQTINNNDNYKCYIICEKELYPVIEDYIVSFYKKINASIILYNKPSEIPKINNNDIYIYVKYIHDEQLCQLNNNTKNVYLLNTEQLVLFDHLPRLNAYPKYIKMLDYNKSNLKYYNGYYTKFLQYQINNDEIYNLPKTKDICIMSNITDYRQKIINELKKKGININIINGWRKERDDKLFTFKIIINLGYSDKHKIFESLRCDRCIFNKMIVISDMKEDIELYNLKNYMIFEEYENITNKTIEVLNNYDIYYKKLGLDTLDLNQLKIEPIIL
jgi:hypothetical protein